MSLHVPLRFVVVGRFSVFALVRACIVAVVALGLPQPASADEVLDWNAVMRRAVRVAAPPVPGPLQARVAAIVHTAMFDAVNGIERRYTHIHVAPDAPKGASPRAAVVQAAYTALTGLFPAQDFEGDLEASLAGISPSKAGDNSQSIARGRLWGEEVAEAVLAWRANDDLAQTVPPTVGNTNPGQWRPTPPGFAPMAVPNMGAITPFAIESVLDFRPGPPLSLTSPEYAVEVLDVKTVGAKVSATRTADQTESANFWAATAMSFWNRAAVTASQQRHLTLSENARLFALLNIAQADALIVCWDSKLYYNYWRPITAIRLADTDGNPDTAPDTAWEPLITTPPYPDYYSGHQSISGTSQAVLTAYFGAQPVEGFSEGLPGVTRHWSSFAAAADEAMIARVWSGIHYRFTQLKTREVAEQIAAYVLAHAAQPVAGTHTGQVPD